MKIPASTDHSTEIGLLALIALGSIALCGFGLAQATTERPFDPSAYLVVLTLIVGAIKERWTQRSVDRMGQNLAEAGPTKTDGPSGEPSDPVNVKPV